MRKIACYQGEPFGVLEYMSLERLSIYWQSQYVLPILIGDDLVARLDPKLERSTMTLEIKGFWHEDNAPLKEIAFAGSLTKRLIRLADFLRAKKVELAGVRLFRLRNISPLS